MNTDKSNQIESLAASAKIFDDCEKVGNIFGLHIDQIGELDSLVRQTLQGQAKSSDFISNLQKNLEIERSLAEKISSEVNKEIFETMKSEIQSKSHDSTINNLEQIGGFSIEKNANEVGVEAPTEDRAKLLNSIENPSSHANNFSEPLIDHLLGNTAGKEEEKIVTSPQISTVATEKVTAVKPITPENLPTDTAPASIPEVRKGPDPYRELIQ